MVVTDIGARGERDVDPWMRGPRVRVQIRTHIDSSSDDSDSDDNELVRDLNFDGQVHMNQQVQQHQQLLQQLTLANPQNLMALQQRINDQILSVPPLFPGPRTQSPNQALNQRNSSQMANQTLQQLLNALRNTTDSPAEQQQRIREIVRGNPQLYGIFVRHQRQIQQVQQQQQRQQMNLQFQQQTILNNQQNPMIQQQRVMGPRPLAYYPRPRTQSPIQAFNQLMQQLLNVMRFTTDSPPPEQRRNLRREFLRGNTRVLAQLIRNQRQRQMFQQQQQQRLGSNIDIGPSMYHHQMQGQPGPQGPNRP